MQITDILIDHEEHPVQTGGFKDVSIRPMFLVDGGKIEFYYSDDFTDSVGHLISTFDFLHEPQK